MFKNLRGYLFHEWQRKAAESSSNYAKEFQLQHSDLHPRCTPPSDCSWPSHSVPALPRQDNHCDCGLYLLSYVEFFCHAARDVLRMRVALIPKPQPKRKSGWPQFCAAWCVSFAARRCHVVRAHGFLGTVLFVWLVLGYALPR